VKRPWAFSGLMSATALLLPLTAVPESRIQTGAAHDALSATARVNFKIIIPKVLYLHVGGGTVALMSNSRNVTLNATVRTPAAASAAAPADSRGCVSVDTHQVVCTASMP
jgi:hypothetical protein